MWERVMKREFVFMTAMVFATPTFAQSVEDSVISQLRAQGFDNITVERTFLGRLRFEAFSDTLERELVINPNTGHVLRDVWEALDDDDRPFSRIGDPHDDEEDDDDDEHDDDDHDEDDDDDDDHDDDDDDDDEEEEDDDDDEDDEDDEDDDEDEEDDDD